MFKQRTHAAVAAFSAILLLAGCGSSSSSSGKGNDDIHLMVVALLTGSAAGGGLTFPYGAAGARAHAASLNKSGGIDGHQVVIDICDNKGDPNASAQCGRAAKSNGDIAVVGTFDPVGSPALLGVLQAEKIPYIGGLPSTAQEMSSPISFQFDPGAVLGGVASGQLFIDSGCKDVAYIAIDNGAAQQTIDAVQGQLSAAGVALNSYKLPSNAVDLSPLISQAMSKHPDCMTFRGDGQNNVKFILSLRKQGYKGKVISGTGSLPPQFLKILGPAADGVLVPSSTVTPTDPDPMTARFAADISAFVGSDPAKIAENSNEFSQAGWSSVELVKQALSGQTTMTSATLLKQIPTMCDVNVGNVYPHVNFCKPAASKLFPRTYNDFWQYFVVKDGQYTATDGKWHNLSASLPS